MAEWAKIVLGALVGLLTGIVLEPVKAAITNWLKCRHAKRDLYRELGFIYALVARAEKDKETFLPKVIHEGRMTLDAFEHYSKSDSITLIRIDSAHALRGFHEAFKTLQDEIEATDDPEKKWERFLHIGLTLEIMVALGQINRRLLNRHYKNAWRSQNKFLPAPRVKTAKST